MLEDLKIILSMLRNQKIILIKNLDKTENINEKNDILNIIFNIDIKLNEYIKKINNKDVLDNPKNNDNNNITNEKGINNIKFDNQINNNIKIANKINKEKEKENSKYPGKRYKQSKSKNNRKIYSKSTETNINKLKE